MCIVPNDEDVHSKRGVRRHSEPVVTHWFSDRLYTKVTAGKGEHVTTYLLDQGNPSQLQKRIHLHR